MFKQRMKPRQRDAVNRTRWIRMDFIILPLFGVWREENFFRQESVDRQGVQNHAVAP